jgi:hypothetical protein
MTNEEPKREKPNAEGTREYAHRITLNAEQNAEHTQATEYIQVNENFWMLADIRFKLLALIPTLGGVAIFLLSEERRTDHGLLLLTSGLGFLATLGVTFYDQRNSALYNALIDRANYLERKPTLPRNPEVTACCGEVGR